MNTAFPLSTEYRIVDGQIVHARHQRVAELLYELDPTLEVLWIPYGERQENEKPFVIVHNQPKDGARYPVMWLDEDEMDHRVIARIIMGRLPAMEQSLAKLLEIEEVAKRALEEKKREDEAAERADLAKHILKSGRARYRHNGVVYE